MDANQPLPLKGQRQALVFWAGAGILLGAFLAVLFFAPATWLASRVAVWTNHRLVLAHATGTLWQGDAQAVLTGGLGSRDARALPGRLGWHWRLRQGAVTLELTQSCCMNFPLAVSIKPGWSAVSAELLSHVPNGGIAAQWPAAWLSGLGAPWNTLALSGFLKLSTTGIGLQWRQGQLSIKGSAKLLFQDVASRVAPLDRLGTYELKVIGAGQSNVDFSLQTLEGALQLSGNGQVGLGRIQFRGEAMARNAEREALSNLLNIIGRRSGDRALLSIG